MRVIHIKSKQIKKFSLLKAISSITLGHRLIINDINVLEFENVVLLKFQEADSLNLRTLKNIVPCLTTKRFKNQIMEVLHVMRPIQTDFYEILYQIPLTHLQPAVKNC